MAKALELGSFTARAATEHLTSTKEHLTAAREYLIATRRSLAAVRCSLALAVSRQGPDIVILKSPSPGSLRASVVRCSCLL